MTSSTKRRAGPREESDEIRCSCVHLGVVHVGSWRTQISDPVARERMNAYRRIEPDAVGRVIQFAIEQPNGVDVKEIVVRPRATQV
jgi:NADP-dependent 3-hydroxy acid dehydrogenase YdfG